MANGYDRSCGWYVVQPDPREDFGAAKAFQATGHLKALITKAWLPITHRVPLPGRLAPLRRRYTPALRDATVYTPHFASLLPLMRYRRQMGHDWERWLRDGQSFGTWASRRIKSAGLGPQNGVFGYTGTMLEPLQFARDVGAQGVLGQVSPGFVWYDILQREAERWGCTYTEGWPDERYKKRVRSEWATASTILVNSRYSKDCIIADGVAPEKIAIAEPPLAPVTVSTAPKTSPSGDEPLRVLFVGTLSLAKGIQYLGQAAELLGSKAISFTAAGASTLPEGFLESKNWPINHVGHQTREALEELYASHHVLVFPTLCDGFGLVQTEAQARGLPVIATTACGDVVQDGVSGFRVPPGDAEAIAAALVQLRDDPALLTSMSEQALTAAQRFTPERYANRLLEHIESQSEFERRS